MRLFALILLALPATRAGICPMEKHQVCNNDDFACTCSVAQAHEAPVPSASCNTLISLDPETKKFPVVSVQFKLGDSVDGLEDWPEDSFREAISTSLRVDESDVIILRVSCEGTDSLLTIQFGILKKDTNTSDVPFDDDAFNSAESIATRMKAMGHLSQIADLDVDSIEFTEDLVDVEYEPDNSELIYKAIGTAVIFGIFFIAGVIATCRHKNDYVDDLQKA